MALFYYTGCLLKMLTALREYTTSVLIAADINYLLSFATNNGKKLNIYGASLTLLQLKVSAEAFQVACCNFCYDEVIRTLISSDAVITRVSFSCRKCGFAV